MAGSEVIMSSLSFRKVLPLLLLVFLLACNLFTVINHLFDLPIADEPQFYDMGKSIWQTGLPYGYSGDLWHPVLSQPLFYHNLLALVWPLDLGFAGPRFLGMLLFIGAILVTIATTRHLGNGNAIWTVILFLAPPLATQGALLVDVDGGLLVLGSAVWAYVWLKFESGRKIRGVFLVAVIALALWAKLLVPVLWCLGALVAGLITRRKEWTKDALLALIGGGLFFTLTWFFYTAAWGLDFWGPFLHGASKAWAGGLSAWGEAVAKGIIRLALWLTPAWLLLVFLPERIRDARETPLLIGGWLIVIVHLGLGVTAFGFPKYFPPAIPLLAIGLAPVLKTAYKRINSIPIGFLGGIVVLTSVVTCLLGDPLLPILTVTRSGFTRSALITSFSCLALPLVLALVIWLWQKSLACFRLALLCGAIGLGAGIMLCQGNADYAVRYIYGEKGLAELLVDLKQNVPAGSSTVLPGDIMFLTDYSYTFHQAEAALEDKAELLKLLTDPTTRAMVLRESFLAHRQYAATLSTVEIIQELKHYKLDQIGSFRLYYR